MELPLVAVSPPHPPVSPWSKCSRWRRKWKRRKGADDPAESRRDPWCWRFTWCWWWCHLVWRGMICSIWTQQTRWWGRSSVLLSSASSSSLSTSPTMPSPSPSSSSSSHLSSSSTYSSRGYAATTRCLVVLLVLCAVHRTCLATCPQGCDCKWKYGKETVECRGSGFIDIPENLDPGTQVIDISQNSLHVLPKDTFLSAGLINLQRIYLQSCKLKQIDQEAFRRLSNLVELDVSHNLMAYVPVAAFREVPGLRRLSMNHNPLQRLDDDVFAPLPSLTTLELSNCKIEYIAPQAFNGLEKLSLLKLDGNLLSVLTLPAVTPLRSLHGFHLHNNPWWCDCNLRPTRHWMLLHNIPVSIPPSCQSPSRLHNVTWDKIPLDDYACEPEVMVLEPRIDVLEGENVTLSCLIAGNPEPTVRWVWKSRTIANLSLIASGRSVYLIHEEGAIEKISNLTILETEPSDSGTYSCIAENRAERVTENVTLSVATKMVEPVGLSTGQISGIVVGAVLFVLVVIVMVCVVVVKYKRRKQRKRAEANHMNSLNHKDHAVIPMEEHKLKYLGPNPVQKPPRMGHYQGVPTTDLDHYEQPYMQNSLTDPVWVSSKEPVNYGEEDTKLTTVLEEDEEKALEESWEEDEDYKDDVGGTPLDSDRQAEIDNNIHNEKIKELEKNRKNEEKLKMFVTSPSAQNGSPAGGGAANNKTGVVVAPPPSPSDEKEKGQLEYEERENVWKDEELFDIPPPPLPSPTGSSSSPTKRPTFPHFPDCRPSAPWSKVPLISPPRGDLLPIPPRPNKVGVSGFEDEGEEGTEV